MVDFRKKFFGLAATAMVFAGAASAQVSSCTAAAPSGAALLRAEGTTELVAEVTLSCTAGPGGAASFQAFVGPSNLTVSNKVITASSNTIDALAIVNGVVAGATLGVSAPGSNSITFNVTGLPATAFTITFANIRVNASAISVGTGVPPSVTETVFAVGNNVQTNTTTTVGFIQRGLTNATTNGAVAGPAGSTGSFITNGGAATNFVICNAVATTTPGFVVRFGENFSTAFKINGGVANTAVGSEFTNNTEAGLYNGTANVGTANSGTRVSITFANVPANVTLYVPTVLIDDAGNAANATAATSAYNLTLVSSATGAYSAVAASTTTGAPAASGAVAITGGTGQAVYEVTKASSSVTGTFTVPVFFQTSANAVTANNSPITAAVSFAPVGSTNVPNFMASAQGGVAGSSFNTCTTSLLFPFVTNQAGFDTGIAISNTSTDPFGAKGATPQSGVCTMNFYGAGAPTAAVTTANIPTATSYANLVSNLAPGFQGYAIAQCAFQFAHGFAFITDGFGGPGKGLSQGYLALIINDTNQIKRSAGTGPAVAGYGEGLTQ